MSPEQIKALRVSLDLTQAEFGLALGVSRLTMSQYEIGFRRPGSTVLILLRVLDSRSKAKGLEFVKLLVSHAEVARPNRKPGRA